MYIYICIILYYIILYYIIKILYNSIYNILYISYYYNPIYIYIYIYIININKSQSHILGTSFRPVSVKMTHSKIPSLGGARLVDGAERLVMAPSSWHAECHQETCCFDQDKSYR